jgi:hypothetical protein
MTGVSTRHGHPRAPLRKIVDAQSREEKERVIPQFFMKSEIWMDENEKNGLIIYFV